jgi:hypothetical protein
VVIKATGTQVNAGAVAFTGDANADIFNGAILVPGLNAAGYNPTAGATTSAIPCQLNGGGAAALPAEPAAPLGWRIRFDIATATAALRGLCKNITQVQAAQVNVNTVLPAVPAVGDVFYIEKAGVIVGGSLLGMVNCGSGAGQGPCIAGIDFSGSITMLPSSPPLNLSFCGCTSILLIQSAAFGCNRFYNDVASGTTRANGGGLRNSGTFSQNGWGNITALTGYTHAAAGTNGVSIESPMGIVAQGAFYSKSGLIVWGGGMVADGSTPQIGSVDTTAPMRITGPNADVIKPGGITFRGTRTSLDGVSITGVGAVPAIVVIGQCVLMFSSFTPAAVITGSTGNTDVGMDLTLAHGSIICLTKGVTPTVTGNLGDVRLAGGQIVSWAQLIASGMTDSQGNRIISLGTAPLGIVGKFSGVMISGEAGASFSYLADAGIGEAIVPSTLQVDPTRYPTSLRLVTRLRACVPLGSSTQALTFTLYKNGAATAMTCTIVAAQPAGTKAVDTAHPILFADGDDYDLRCDVPGVMAANVAVSALLEGPA